MSSPILDEKVQEDNNTKLSCNTEETNVDIGEMNSHSLLGQSVSCNTEQVSA